jgi:hypothetical protein
MSLEEARRAFKARVREAVTPELLGQLRADINRVVGEGRIHLHHRRAGLN